VLGIVNRNLFKMKIGKTNIKNIFIKSLALFFVSLFFISFLLYKAEAQTINSSPNLEYAGPTSPLAPSWVKDLILYQMRVDTFTPEGTFDAARSKLDYLQELGITGIVLNPVTDFDGGFIGKERKDPRHIYYGVKDPTKIDSLLGNEEGFKSFVKEAHNRGIKVFLDFVTAGVVPRASMYDHPEKWMPIAGDWNGDKKDTTGILTYPFSIFHLDNNNTDAFSDVVFQFIT